MALIDALNPLDQRLKLPDGRWLGFAEFGDPEGQPVMLFHGLPGSRLPSGHPVPTAETAPGLRYIGVDRPGMGLSTFQRKRRIADWPTDVSALAEALGLGRFAVLGGSGGAPYALVCAYRMPGPLSHVVVVSGMAPMDRSGAYRGLPVLSRVAWWSLAHVPGQRRTVAWLQGRMMRRGRGRGTVPGRMVRQMSRADRDVLKDQKLQAGVVRNLAEAYRDGSRGVAHELKLLTQAWGFPLEDIKAEVHLWQGTDDRNVPRAMGEYLAATIPHCRASFVPGAGHLLADPRGEIARLLREPTTSSRIDDAHSGNE